MAESVWPVSSLSMIATTAGSFGFVPDPNRATTVPLRSIRNFSKFQPILPAPLGLVSSDVRNLYSSQAFSPFTSTLANMSNVTP